MGGTTRQLLRATRVTEGSNVLDRIAVPAQLKTPRYVNFATVPDCTHVPELTAMTLVAEVEPRPLPSIVNPSKLSVTKLDVITMHPACPEMGAS